MKYWNEETKTLQDTPIVKVEVDETVNVDENAEVEKPKRTKK